MKRFILFAWTVSISAAWGAVERPRPATPPVGVSITLVGRAADLGVETVNFGLPLAPGFRSDPDLVRVYDAAGAEIEAAVSPLEPWRIDGRKGTIRSLQIQFRADFRRLKTQRIKVAFDQKRRQKPGGFVPVLQTLIDKEGLKGPRVLAVIPAKWLCDSWVVGPQVSAAESGAYSSYDRLVEANFPGSLKYIASTTFDHCLFDRTTCWYKMYVRTGDRKLLEAAYEGAQCLRTHTRMDGPDAGMFIPKGKPDLKYISPKMTGIDLAEELQSRHPRIKAILVSGYTPPVDTAAHEWSFLMKPFTIQR